MKKVVILQHRLVHYRMRLFDLLRTDLERKGIELVLVHGQASKTEIRRKDEGRLDWAEKIKNRFIYLGRHELIWQTLPPPARKADLYIIMQENRILSNYVILLFRLFVGTRVAYWGHGRNYQSTAPTGFREIWKTFLLNKVDWWFAYTDLTKQHLIQSNFQEKKITDLQNAIDVTGFKRDLRSVSHQDIENLRARLNLDKTDRIGIFCGSLYPEKRIDLLIASSVLIKERIPNFHLIVIGSGPSAQEISDFANGKCWVHIVGAKSGIEKARLFRLGQVQLNPGLVGLHVLDAFSAGLPMITTATALHSPEIAYLKDGVNGLISASDDVEDYADSVVSLLSDDNLRQRLSGQSLKDANSYTVENMVSNFSEGISHCLRS